MSAHDLLNLLNELGKMEKKPQGSPSILIFFRNESRLSVSAISFHNVCLYVL